MKEEIRKLEEAIAGVPRPLGQVKVPAKDPEDDEDGDGKAQEAEDLTKGKEDKVEESSDTLYEDLQNLVR